MFTKNYPFNRIGQHEHIAVPISFETDEKGAFTLDPLPYRCKVISAKTAVTKALGASDTGTVAIKRGGTTVATVTLAASAAIGEEDEAPSVAETIFDTSDQISITPAKTTAGGKAMLYLTVEVLTSH